LGDDADGKSSSMAEQNVELRRRLDEERSGYRRKLQTYQDEQQRQMQLVQRLQAKVGYRSVMHVLHAALSVLVAERQ